MANIDAIKILGSLLGSGALSRGSGSNVLGSLVGALTGGGQAPAGQSSGGGLGGLVGSMLGGGQSSGGGGIGDLLGGLLGGGDRGAGQSAGLGGLIGMAMNQFGAAQRGQPVQPRDERERSLPSGVQYAQAEAQAETLIRAMINAAKADGRVDAEEQQKIVDRLGDVSDDELAFLRREFAAPLDVEAFARSIPAGTEQQVYAMSLMAIDLDSNPEAQYLHQLAQATGISADLANRIHEQLGAPKLYR